MSDIEHYQNEYENGRMRGILRYDLWDLHVSQHKNPRVTSYLRPVHLVILGHGTQLPPPAEGEVKTAGGAEPILRQPGYQLRPALTATS